MAARLMNGYGETSRVVINGREREIININICNQRFVIEKGIINILRLDNEWFDELREQNLVLNEINNQQETTVDVFTFWQRPISTTPLFNFPMILESVALLHIDSYEKWFRDQIPHSARKAIRKSQKSGVVVREVSFDEDFVRGMASIFNEASVRQGRRFWHYGKSLDKIREQFSSNLHREKIFGAYHEGRLIGFFFLAYSNEFANFTQIISTLRDRDKAPTNALVARAVEVCAGMGLQYLTYAQWSPPGGLSDFKQANGFQKVDVPRYFVPVTWKGRVALRAGIHRDWKEALPPALRARLKNVKARLVQIGR